ncbi:MAG TPA: hypothetical protein VG388_08340 [Solirubrobacteraceae bacterium]|nr:hypothetical protein [Solirubrobacteraceae bacterium]
MFHVEVRQFPNVARAFNLSDAELKAKVLVPWSRRETVLLGEREWEPAKSKLTVLEGREIGKDELGLGRGWANASRDAEDVTERVLAAAQTQGAQSGAAAGTGGLATFKDVVWAQCASDRLAIHQVMWLANSRHPEWRVSERVALAERAVWELLHEGRLTLLRRAAAAEGPEFTLADRSQWEPALLAWVTWSEPAEPRWFVLAAPE